MHMYIHICMLIFYDFMSWPGCVYIYIYICVCINIWCIYIYNIFFKKKNNMRVCRNHPRRASCCLLTSKTSCFFFGSRFDLQNHLNPASTNFMKMETAEICRGFEKTWCGRTNFEAGQFVRSLHPAVCLVSLVCFYRRPPSLLSL